MPPTCSPGASDRPRGGSRWNTPSLSSSSRSRRSAKGRKAATDQGGTRPAAQRDDIA
jgi:hypothetical protein